MSIVTPLDIPQRTEKSSEPELEVHQNKIWWLYLIETRSGTLYCGITLDVERRLNEHQSSSAKSARFLRGKGPLVLKFKALAGSHSQALKAERQVKKLTRAKKEDLIAGDSGLLARIGLSIPKMS